MPTGSVINYQSDDWYAGWFTNTDDVISAVAQKLSQDGLTVRSSSSSINGAMGSVDKWLGGGASFTVTMKVEVTGGSGYSSTDDVASIINHEAWSVTQHLPGSWSVPSYSLPGTFSLTGISDWLGSLFSGVTKTGQPASSSGTDLLSSITSKGLLWIALMIIGFVGALALIGYSGALKHME